MSHDRDRDRDWNRRRDWGGGWNDWRFFGIPQPYPVPVQAYVAPQPVVCPAPAYFPPTPALPGYFAQNRPQLVQTLFGQDRGILVAPSAAIVAPTRGISTPLSFRSRKISGRKTRTVIARPQVAFQPMSLFIPWKVAKHFEIKALYAGHHSLLSTRDSIPAEYYSNRDGCSGRLLQLPPLIPGQSIYLRVRNTSSHKHKFRAVLDGVTLSL